MCWIFSHSLGHHDHMITVHDYVISFMVYNQTSFHVFALSSVVTLSIDTEAYVYLLLLYFVLLLIDP